MQPEKRYPDDRGMPHSAQALQPRQALGPDGMARYLEQVWDIVIVAVCGKAPNEVDRRNFIQGHLDPQYPASEWRFGGSLGFGGKFRMRPGGRATVECYPEDATPLRQVVIALANAQLEGLLAQAWTQQSASAGVPRPSSYEDP